MTGKNLIMTLRQQYVRYRPLLRELIVRDLKLKYRRSILGYLWSLLNPLLMMTVMTVVFSYMFRFDIPNYPMYLICGQTLWTFFNESTTVAMQSVISNSSLIRKVYIPKFIFPISRVVSSFVTMSFSMAAILVVMIFTGVRVTPAVVLFPVPLMALLLFSMGIGIALSALAVYFRDIVHLYGVLTLVWMYVTPIFYPISALPGTVASLLRLNPLYHYITFFREVLLYGTVPALSSWLCCFGFAVASLVLGIGIFRRLQRNFILYV